MKQGQVMHPWTLDDPSSVSLSGSEMIHPPDRADFVATVHVIPAELVSNQNGMIGNASRSTYQGCDRDN